jgi:hypothetical protein
MNLPFGLRDILHTLYVRKTTHTDVNANQQHGVAFSYAANKIRTEVMAIAGNFQIRPDDFRERGYAGYIEYAPMTTLAVGASSMMTHANADPSGTSPIIRHAHGLFGRYSPHKVVVLMSEMDMLVTSMPACSASVTTQCSNASPATKGGFAGYLQADLEPVTGVHLIFTGELKDETLSRDQPSYAAWAGAQWFFLPHVDARFDLIGTTAPGGINSTTWLLNLHGYL